MHLGLIGGIGPAATEFYYRGLVQAYAALDETLELTIVNASSPPLLANMARGAADEQARIFQGYLDRLKAAGADVGVVTSLSGHFCIRELAAVSPLPLLDALPALDAYFAAEGIRARRTPRDAHRARDEAPRRRPLRRARHPARRRSAADARHLCRHGGDGERDGRAEGDDARDGG